MSERTIHKSGKLRGEKVLFVDGLGCCVWYPINDHDDFSHLGFNFPLEDIDDFIDLLNQLKNAKPEIYEEPK